MLMEEPRPGNATDLGEADSVLPAIERDLPPDLPPPVLLKPEPSRPDELQAPSTNRSVDREIGSESEAESQPVEADDQRLPDAGVLLGAPPPPVLPPPMP